MNQMNVWGMTDIGLVRKENQDAYATAQHEATRPPAGPPMPSHTTPTVRPEASCCAVA